MIGFTVPCSKYVNAVGKFALYVYMSEFCFHDISARLELSAPQQHVREREGERERE